jgi:hypothetical protein
MSSADDARQVADLAAATLDLDSKIISEPGVYDIPAALYHADPVLYGSLSSTGLRVIIEPGGPARFKHRLDHRLEDDRSTEAFDFGRAAHQVILGDPENHMVVVDAGNWRTKAAQQAADEARAAGLTPILAPQWEIVLAMAKEILNHPLAAGLLQASSGKPEQTIVWEDLDSGVWCRARIDWLRKAVAGKRLLIIDYKTTKAADRESFGKSSANFGYFVQAAFYLAGVKALGLDDDPAFLFVAQEKAAPYLVNVLELDDAALTIGRNLMRIGLNRYADCRRTGQWPGLGDEIDLVSLPQWFLKQHDEG